MAVYINGEYISYAIKKNGEMYLFQRRIQKTTIQKIQMQLHNIPGYIVGGTQQIHGISNIQPLQTNTKINL